MRVYDDYAHHPTEIAASLTAARDALAGAGRLIAVFQPGTYSRTQTFAREFADAMAIADIAVVHGHLPGPRGTDPRRHRRHDQRPDRPAGRPGRLRAALRRRARAHRRARPRPATSWSPWASATSTCSATRSATRVRAGRASRRRERRRPTCRDTRPPCGVETGEEPPPARRRRRLLLVVDRGRRVLRSPSRYAGWSRSARCSASARVDVHGTHLLSHGPGARRRGHRARHPAGAAGHRRHHPPGRAAAARSTSAQVEHVVPVHRRHHVAERQRRSATCTPPTATCSSTAPASHYRTVAHGAGAAAALRRATGRHRPARPGAAVATVGRGAAGLAAGAGHARSRPSTRRRSRWCCGTVRWCAGGAPTAAPTRPGSCRRCCERKGNQIDVTDPDQPFTR